MLGDLAGFPLEAINSLCWCFWKISLATEAIHQFQSYVSDRTLVESRPVVDSLLLAQVMFDVEWQRLECFFEYHTLVLMNFPPLEWRVE